MLAEVSIKLTNTAIVLTVDILQEKITSSVQNVEGSLRKDRLIDGFFVLMKDNMPIDIEKVHLNLCKMIDSMGEM